MEQSPLFCREPVSISGYTPKFSRREVLMNYRYEEREAFRGFGVWDENEPPRITKEHSIVVLDTKITGHKEYYNGSNYAIVVAIANEYIEGYRKTKPPAYVWLTENAVDLSNSVRYWKAMIRIDGINKAKREIEDLKNQIRIGEILASVDAVGVLREETIPHDDRYLLAVEFGMTPEEYKGDR